jgi:glycosyltransferase involved in cell wall biosynthesis
MKKVSIIIAVYNAENYIGECLNSIERQTYPDIEVICVNDGSSDHSQAIIEKVYKYNSNKKKKRRTI